jgi:hypothetical protein
MKLLDEQLEIVGLDRRWRSSPGLDACAFEYAGEASGAERGAARRRETSRMATRPVRAGAAAAPGPAHRRGCDGCGGWISTCQGRLPRNRENMPARLGRSDQRVQPSQELNKCA